MGWSNLAAAVIEVNEVIVVGGTVNSGVFIYSGTPASGNLIGSWAGAAGTDPFGNTYPKGLNVSIGAISGSTISGSVLNIAGSSAGLFFYSPSAGAGNLIGSWAVSSGTDAFGNAFPAGLNISGPGALASAINVPLTSFTSGRPEINFTTPTGTIFGGIYSDVVSLDLDIAIGTIGGPLLVFDRAVNAVLSVNTPFLGSIVAVQPSTTDTLETWHAPVLGTGWASGPAGGGVVQGISYRLAPDGTVQVIGCFHSTSATPASPIWTMPTGYIPAAQQRLSVVNFSPAAANVFLVGTDGSVILTTNPASGTDCYVDVFYRLS